jgi:hypothetical protein
VTTTPEVEHHPNLLANVRNGTWLDEQTFPPLQWAIDGLIPEGASILIGPPKVGKSYFLGGLLLAKAAGTRALGRISTGTSRTVLYLALEDGDRRMQTRCRELLGTGQPIPERFNYITVVEPRQVIATIEMFLELHPDTALIVLDTLGKVMPEARPGESSYQRDYRIAGALKKVADDHPGLALVVVHHDRKAISEDFVESVSGTNGLAGAMDTICVLVRKRQSTEGVLKITGRDVPEAEYALTVDNGHWLLDGANLAAAAGTAATRQESDGLGDRSTQIVQIVNANPTGISPTKLAEVLDIAPKHAGEYLRRLAGSGRIDKSGRGNYRPAHTVETVESVETPGESPLPFPQSPASVETEHDSTSPISTLSTLSTGGVHSSGDCDRCEGTPTRVDNAGNRLCQSCAGHLWAVAS